MQDCIFCKIVNREIPAKVVYEDEKVLVFHDINPVAPIHLLLIPKQHIPHLLAADEVDEALLGHLQLVAGRVAKDLGL
ncbi:Histidine triad (HIT) protein [Carboxydocella sp. JDF658]|nr:Histidine triad (HIT) protein [Carboxydocella sp. JDF658]